MILFVRAENFRSIGEKQELNLIPSSDKSHLKNIINYTREQSLSVVPIYGGNATGKTNVLRVIKTLKEIITLDKGIESYYDPCKFSEEDDIHLEIIFFKENVKYYYAIKYNETKIVEEKLYHYPNEKIAKIFDRTEEKPYGTEFEKVLKKYGEDTPDTIPMLKFLATWLKGKNSSIDTAYNFFANDVITVHMGEEISIKESIKAFKTLNDNDKAKEFINFFYRHLNIGAQGIRVRESVPKELVKKLKDSEGENLTPEFISEWMANSDVYSLELIYKVNGKEITMDIKEESKGIQKVFTIGRFLADALCNNKVVIFDELELSFHPILSKKIIELFFDEGTNAQLIFTTHDTNLLDLNLFRRDQIYFTARTKETGFQTNIKSLSEIPNIRKTTDIEKAYLQGKYCSLPLENDFPVNDLMGELK